MTEEKNITEIHEYEYTYAVHVISKEKQDEKILARNIVTAIHDEYNTVIVSPQQPETYSKEDGLPLAVENLKQALQRVRELRKTHAGLGGIEHLLKSSLMIIGHLETYSEEDIELHQISKDVKCLSKNDTIAFVWYLLERIYDTVPVSRTDIEFMLYRWQQSKNTPNGSNKPQ